jgi:hypothetical protein
VLLEPSPEELDDEPPIEPELPLPSGRSRVEEPALPDGRSIDEDPVLGGFDSVPDSILLEPLPNVVPEPVVLELLSESIELPVPELVPEPIVLDPVPEVVPAPALPPVEGEAAVAPVRLPWSLLELVLLPAAYAADAAPIIRTAAKLVSVKFRMKNSSNKLDRA